MPTIANGVNFSDKSVTIQKAKVDILTGDILLDENDIPIASSITAPIAAVKIKTNGVNFLDGDARDANITVELGSDYIEIDGQKLFDEEVFFSVSGSSITTMDAIWEYVRDNF